MEERREMQNMVMTQIKKRARKQNKTERGTSLLRLRG
jgi:hypothetical protein